MADYVKNKTLYLELIKCRDASLAYTDELVDMFILISKNLSKKFQYVNEQDRDDCIWTGVEDCLKYWHNFDPSISTNAFAYCTQVTKNGFAKGFRKLYPYASVGVTQISIDRNKIYNL